MTWPDPIVLPPYMWASLTDEARASGRFVRLQPLPEPRPEAYQRLVRCEGHDLQLPEPDVPDWLEAMMPRFGL